MQNATTEEFREPDQGTPVLLVVDDDAAVLVSLKFCLEIDGFDVKSYASGEALLNCWRNSGAKAWACQPS